MTIIGVRKLTLQVQYIENHKSCIGVGGLPILIGDIKYYKNVKSYENSRLYFEDFFKFNSVGLSSLLIKNNGILFREDEEFRYVEDFEIQLRLTNLNDGYIKLINERLFYYRIHFNSGSLNKKYLLYIFNVLNIYRDQIYFIEFFKSKSIAYSIIAVKYIHNFSYEGLKFSFKSIIFNPFRFFNYLVYLYQ